MGGCLCVGTTLLEEEVWPWRRILHYVLKKVHGGHLEPLCQKPQAVLAKNPSNYSSNWKVLDRCQVQLALGDLGVLLPPWLPAFKRPDTYSNPHLTCFWVNL